MGFNALRNVFCMMPEELLDLCDELGVLVYREPVSSLAYIPIIPGGFAENSHWKAPLDDLKRQRWLNTWTEAITRDRNHPSIVMWGVVNETPPGPLLDLGRAALPHIRKVDTTRVVVLNSGGNAAILTTDGKVADVSSSAVGIGNLSNPGSAEWDMEVSDIHAYKKRATHKRGRQGYPNDQSPGTAHDHGERRRLGKQLDQYAKKYEEMGRSNAADAILSGQKARAVYG